MDVVIADRYRLVRLLGKGGMGEVHEAVQLDTGRLVALKRVTHQDASGVRLQREARAIAAVRSPHIVEILDSGIDANLHEPFLVMELLRGEDLSETLSRTGRLPADLAVRIAIHACRGLDKAHAVGIVHRDIKPANLFLEQHAGEIRVKLVDFGLARTFAASDEAAENDLTQLTKKNTILGSPAYMAPEQIRGLKNVDHRCDVWSLGVVLYRMLAGHSPHPRGDSGLGDLLVSICSTPAPPLQLGPEAPPQLAGIVHTALALSPDRRFQSARAMQVALERLVHDTHILSTSMATVVPTGPTAPGPTHDLTRESSELSTLSLARDVSLGSGAAPAASDGLPVEAALAGHAELPPPRWHDARALVLGGLLFASSVGFGYFAWSRPGHAPTALPAAMDTAALQPSGTAPALPPTRAVVTPEASRPEQGLSEHGLPQQGAPEQGAPEARGSQPRLPVVPPLPSRPVRLRGAAPPRSAAPPDFVRKFE